MGKLRQINVDLNRQYRTDLNWNFTQIEADILALESGDDQQHLLDELARIERESKERDDVLANGNLEALLQSIEDAKAKANNAAANADVKATHAQTQGDYAKSQGDYAKAQGDYAKLKGDYADEKAIVASEAAANANLEASNLDGLKVAVTDATQMANLAAEKANNAQGPQGDIGPIGPKGEKGDIGLTGPQGEQGPQGVQGIEGPKGVKGEKGDKGDTGAGLNLRGTLPSADDLPLTGEPGDGYIVGLNLFVWEGSVWFDAGPFRGPKGDKGDKGEQGIRGITGLDGAKGEQGIQGPKGEKGDAGKDGLDADVSALATKSELQTETDARIIHEGLNISESPVHGLNYKDDALYILVEGKWVEFKNSNGSEKIFIYGVKIDTLNSNPETAVTYTDDAVGFTPLRVIDGVANWGSWADKYPFNENVPVVVKNGVEQYELNPNDFTKKKDGSPSIITGADGDAFSRFSKIWWKIERIGTDLFVKMATGPVEGFKCLAHTVAGVEKDYVYIGTYMGFAESGKLRSVSGKTVTASQTIGTFREQAQANGNGYTQFDYYKSLMVQVMTLIATKSRDSQSAIGRGYVDGNSGYVDTGGTNVKGMVYGETTGKLQMKIFGIEDFWGNYFQFIDGLFCDSDRNILIGDNGFNDTGVGYLNYGQGAASNISGYISDVQGGTESGFIAKVVTGSETTHYADSGILFAGRLPYFGGDRSAGSHAGAFRLDALLAASYAAANYSARCCFVK